jgi:hypothetical protein
VTRTRRATAAAAALGALGLGLWALVIEPARLVARDVALDVPEAPGLSATFALVSDVHAGCNFVDEARLARIVDLVNGRDVDVVALLGDYVTENRFARPLPPEAVARAFGRFRARAGAFAVLGNHDWWFDGPRVRRAFEAAGVRVLDGESVEVETRGGRLRLLGVPDYASRREASRRAARGAPVGPPLVALTHSPDVFPDVPDRVALTFAGHTHGGQVALPWLGRPVVPSAYGERYAAGHVVERGRHLFVTTGLGMSILPVRLGVPPEVAFVRVNAR